MTSRRSPSPRAAATAAPRPVVRVEDGRKVLRVGDVIQSVAVDETYTPDVWDALLPPEQPANALILGLGGGVIATLLTQRWGPLPIVGVERDPEVARLAREEFGLERLPNVEVVVADAFAFVQALDTRFDAICVDLYVGGRLAHGVLGGRFLSAIARLLSERGVATFNLWESPYLDGQLRRLARWLTVFSVTQVDENIVVSCRRSDAGDA